MPTLFLTNLQKPYNGEKTASSTNAAGKSGYMSAENSHEICACDPILVSTQTGLITLISDMKPLGYYRKVQGCMGSNRYKQGLHH
jgi:hypothetical protein